MVCVGETETKNCSAAKGVEAVERQSVTTQPKERCQEWPSSTEVVDRKRQRMKRRRWDKQSRPGEGRRPRAAVGKRRRGGLEEAVGVIRISGGRGIIGTVSEERLERERHRERG